MLKKVVIVDFGSQVTQLIARSVRSQKVYCEVVPFNKFSLKYIKNENPVGIILSGSPLSVTKRGFPSIKREIFFLGIPILGICYGMQLISSALGGKIKKISGREYGDTSIRVIKKSSICPNNWKTKTKHNVWMSHGDSVKTLPKNFISFAKSNNENFVGIANEKMKIFGLQFHPEVTHTKDGKSIIKKFLFEVCKCKPQWNMKKFKKENITLLKKKLVNKKVICGLSGGVDSSVAALLLNKAIGKRLLCIFVDHGLLRMGEKKEIHNFFKRKSNFKFISVDASKQFMKVLKGVTDPEKKRKLIGKEFIKTFDKCANKYKGIEYLAQGTLYPDVIESRSVTGAPSATIKSHHNVGGLPKKMNLKLVEPLNTLFKDEVRILGKELGLSDNIRNRHPFPGPGLAIRILGEVTKSRLEILRQADKIYIDLLKKEKLYDKIWQAFCVLLPVKTVGVMGDSRTYENVCAIRAVTSVDGMTADYYHFDQTFLKKVSNNIINKVKGINRVVYDTTSKPPGTIEWE